MGMTQRNYYQREAARRKYLAVRRYLSSHSFFRFCGAQAGVLIFPSTA
jgi:hypothetical protein